MSEKNLEILIMNLSMTDYISVTKDITDMKNKIKDLENKLSNISEVLDLPMDCLSQALFRIESIRTIIKKETNYERNQENN